MINFIIAAATSISTVSSIKAGKAQKAESEANAKQMEVDNALLGAQAMQQHNARAAIFSDATSANTAFFAFSGRDVSDMSVKAFLERQKQIYIQEQVVGGSQATAEQSKMTMLATAERKRGKNALVAGYLGAAGNIASGLYQAKTVRRPSGSTSSGVPMTGGRVNKSTTTGYTLGIK